MQYSAMKDLWTPYQNPTKMIRPLITAPRFLSTALSHGLFLQHLGIESNGSRESRPQSRLLVSLPRPVRFCLFNLIYLHFHLYTFRQNRPMHPQEAALRDLHTWRRIRPVPLRQSTHVSLQGTTLQTLQKRREIHLLHATLHPHPL